MKKIKILLVSVMALAVAGLHTGCKKEYPLTYQNDPALYFGGIYYSNTLVSDSLMFSFVDIESESVQWNLAVITQGLPTDYDRKFIIKQINGDPAETAYDKAVAAEDFISLDLLEEFMVIPAGQVVAIVPLIFNYTDKLLHKKMELGLEIIPTDEFRNGIADLQNYKIKFTGEPQQPSNWSEWSRYFGSTWGPVKHMFIIRTCGPIKWEDVNETYMQTIARYFGSLCQNALAEYNANNPQLMENEQEPVVF